MYLFTICLFALQLFAAPSGNERKRPPTVKIGIAEIENYRATTFGTNLKYRRAANLAGEADQIAAVPGTWDVSVQSKHRLVLTNALIDKYGRCSFIVRTVNIGRYNSRIWLPTQNHRVALLRRSIRIKHRGMQQVFDYLTPVQRM